MMKDNKTSKESRERIVYYDVLRIVATLAVILMHVAAYHWDATEITSFEWNVFNFYAGIVRWSVPIFVMISGALFLNSEHTVKKIFSKNILHIVTAFVFWSVIYALVWGDGKRDIFFRTLGGNYHLWFLFMIAGLYLIVPFLREIVKSRKMTRYFLVLACLFTFVFPQLLDIMAWSETSFVQELAMTFEAMLVDIRFHMGLGYTFYFVAGYYLSKIEIPKYIRKIIYLLGIIGLVVTIACTVRTSIMNNEPSGFWYANFTMNVMIQSIAIFVFAKYNLNLPRIKEKGRKIVYNLSKYSFGVYLVHVMIIEILGKKLGFSTLSFNAVVSVPVIVIIVAVCSFVISALIHHIPVLKKYIV